MGGRCWGSTKESVEGGGGDRKGRVVGRKGRGGGKGEGEGEGEGGRERRGAWLWKFCPTEDKPEWDKTVQYYY